MSNSSAELVNPDAISGHNEAPISAQSVTAAMARDYAALAQATSALLVEAKALPDAVADEGDLQVVSAVIVKIRDKAKLANATREKEKEPYLRGGQAVDAFFKDLIDRLDKTNTILGRRVNAYQQAKLAEERARRAAEAREAARVASEAAARLAEQERLAREATEAAARARKAENIAAHNEEAADHAELAAAAARAAALALNEAAAAELAAKQKPAELTRSRFEEGTLVTMKQVGYVEIVDAALLDLAALRPFIKEEHLLQALRAWAKINNHKKPMPGAIVEMRDEAVVR
jgi:hypothetical protein